MLKRGLATYFLLLGFSFPLFAQIVREQGVEIPAIPKEMTYREYQMLTRDLNWKRIAISSMVPGFIHYYAQHRKAACAIAAIRGTGMLTSAIGMLRQWKNTKHLNFTYGKSTEDNLYIFMAGMILNAAGYAYDWAHGDWIIEKERTIVQYKYGIKKGMAASSFRNSNNSKVLFFTLNLNFQ